MGSGQEGGRGGREGGRRRGEGGRGDARGVSDSSIISLISENVSKGLLKISINILGNPIILLKGLLNGLIWRKRNGFV